ncbi:hypothetical protein RclHR1_25060001 [Rhizophagus clarus]|uniref:Uncharacterized protein n=1 Tax=Rhizophagus clarus TaxID=94130 RepID=A0A2Z6RBJ7_9GLOM|nr:hypothetical protein RclHR1_25060001 [Rhizophagus clarus]GES91220.1 hypothetical protein RCL_jg25184.t1 [Rhizophagus clarus]
MFDYPEQSIIDKINHQNTYTQRQRTLMRHQHRNSLPADTKSKTKENMPNAHRVIPQSKIYNEDTSSIAETEDSANIVVNTQEWSLGKFF